MKYWTENIGSVSTFANCFFRKVAIDFPDEGGRAQVFPRSTASLLFLSSVRRDQIIDKSRKYRTATFLYNSSLALVERAAFPAKYIGKVPKTLPSTFCNIRRSCFSIILSLTRAIPKGAQCRHGKRRLVRKSVTFYLMSNILLMPNRM